MKKTLTTALLALVALAASAQVNEVIDSLFARIDRMGHMLDRTQYATDYGKYILYQYNATGTVPEGGRWDDDPDDIISERMAALCRDAEYSQHYETHATGADTVMYAICLSGAKHTRQIKSPFNSSVYIVSKPDSDAEYVTYNYQRSAKECHAFLTYSHTIPLHEMQWQGHFFDPEPLRAVVAETMRRLNVKGHDFTWKYYNDSNREDYQWNYPFRAWETPSVSRLDGEAKGVIYSIPRDNKAFADYVLQNLYDDVGAYLDNLSGQQYYFYLRRSFYTEFKHLNKMKQLANMFSANITSERPLSKARLTPENRNRLHYIYLLSDEHGYHIMEFDVVDALRIPYEPSLLKSIDGNTKEYTE